MTREEAINQLKGLKQYFERCIPAVGREVFDMAIEALHKNSATLDRSRWEGCERCNKDTVCGLCLNKGRIVYCQDPEDEDCGYFEKMQFCPVCGKPLTEKAWTDLERRLNGG